MPTLILVVQVNRHFSGPHDRQLIKQTVYENVEELRKEIDAKWSVAYVHYVPRNFAIADVHKVILGNPFY